MEKPVTDKMYVKAKYADNLHNSESELTLVVLNYFEAMGEGQVMIHSGK